MSQREYVLGHYDEEVDRLGLQHRVWRPWMTECWRTAGFTTGQRLIDAGAGPGYATLDLAEIVGPSGKVVSLELSDRFVEIGRQRCIDQGLTQVDYRLTDLVRDELSIEGFDGAWCRWVLSFVSDPQIVVDKIARSLRPGGIFAVHEYLEYSTWTFLPPKPAQRKFVEITEMNWRSAGGEPDVALQLPALLKSAGFSVLQAKPILFTIRPTDYAWNWPSAWIASSSKRLVDTGELGASEAAEVQLEFEEAGSDPSSLMLSPSVLEVVARKE